MKKSPAPSKAAVKKSPAPSKAAVKKSPAPSKTAVQNAKVPKKSTAAPGNKAEKKTGLIAPIVKIEEIDEELQTPSMPEVHEEEEEKIIEIVEGQVVNSHIRFSDAEEEEEDKAAPKDASINSDDFEALEEVKDEPAPFELYNSEESEFEDGAEAEKSVGFGANDEFDGSLEEIEKELSPVANAHSAFEVFSSQEPPKTFNWSHEGSTYYQGQSDGEEGDAAEIEDMPQVPTVQDNEAERSPVVISNPFGFGFTATTSAVPVEREVVATALDILSNSAIDSVSRPNPYSFHSHFQSVSSPLDKLCTLTSQSNPIAVARTFGNSDNSNLMVATSSYLPTSPAAGMSKASRSPSINGEDKEARSPAPIQCIIVDDKHEDFSAF